MADSDLKGVGVLVTRPAHQSDALVAAIEHAGGMAYRFPVMRVTALPADGVAAARAAIPAPDVVVFISRNAVEHGIGFVGSALIAAIGPATATAIEACGQHVDIRADSGADSESLLATEVMQDVASKTIMIVRGTHGREYLGDELERRGADVHYLATYERVPTEPTATERAQLESAWRSGDIDVVTVMSVESLEFLIELLPEWCRTQLEITPLVTPAARVLKEALNRFPAARPVLASGPEAEAMVAAIVATRTAFEHTGPE